ncbi:MAG: class II glutamine amidotransferase [Candidatus Wallbacteria bacterium]
MCELLCADFNKKINLKWHLEAFKCRAFENPDGFGLAWYEDECAQIVKSPENALESRLYDNITKNNFIGAQIIMAHVRYSSVGVKTLKNCHPFSRELDGKNYLFMHNGTISAYQKFGLKRFQPLGHTDSEHLFCHILAGIEKNKISEWNESNFKKIHDIFKRINEKGNFNCVLSDGSKLFCYYDKNGYNGLCFVRHDDLSQGDINFKQLDAKFSYKKCAEKNSAGFVIASRPLSYCKWQPFKFGEMIVFENGSAIYSTARDTAEINDCRLISNYDHISNLENEILNIIKKQKNAIKNIDIFNSLLQGNNELNINKEYFNYIIFKLLCESKIFMKYEKSSKPGGLKWHDNNTSFIINECKTSF